VNTTCEIFSDKKTKTKTIHYAETYSGDSFELLYVKLIGTYAVSG